MDVAKKRSLEIPLTIDNYETAFAFIEQCLRRNHIKDDKAITETNLLFEAILNNLIEQGYDQNTTLTIKVKKSFGEIYIKLGFEGKSYVPEDTKQDGVSPELKMIQVYNDKISYRYQMGYNSIRVVVKRNYRSSLMHCALGALLAILTYILMITFMSEDQQLAFDNTIISPLIKQFANAMMMVGAPVTLFSLVKNLTDIYIVSEMNSSGKKLQMKTIATSVIAIVLALVTSVFASGLINTHAGYLGTENIITAGIPSFDFISSMVPSSIFEPFQTYMPFPMIIVALLITYAFCSIGKYFDVMQRVIDICYTLFSRMLKVVMFTLPFFFFLSIITSLLEDGFEDLILMARFIAAVLLSLIVIFAFYLIRLLIGGVRIIPFIKHLMPLIWENIKINSAIDAVPFNIRYCAKEYKYDLKRLSEKLPILAQTNLDGNCFLITLVSMLFIFLLGIEISWLHIIAIAILVLFLSLGAPNQPGSMLIGILIITFFLQADDLIVVAIYAEVFFGTLQNIINVIGDIVTVAIEEQKSV